jgi:ATP-dependent Clp protease ATP-binding subunit ClpA
VFERFSHQARRVVVLAREDARARSAERIDPDHLLVCLLDDPGALVAGVLSDVGIDRGDVTSELTDVDRAGPDRAALAALGIDLDEVRRRVEQSFGPGALDRAAARQLAGRGRRWRGHISFSHAAKRALELAMREAVRRGDRHIGAEHVLLGVLGVDGIGSRLLAARGRTLDDVRAALARRALGAEGA